MATATRPIHEPDPQVVLANVSWETYEKLLADLADGSAPRLTYDDGLLEIISPTPEHERLNRTINLIVEIVASELDVPIEVLGSSTFKRKELRRGFEPDSCFYVANAERVCDKKRIDLAVDPPPDLVVEIDVTSSSIPRMPIYARVRVPEVWQYDGRSLRMSRLQGNKYTRIDKSLSFPILTARVVEDFVTKSLEWKNRPRLIRFIRDWVAANR